MAQPKTVKEGSKIIRNAAIVAGLIVIIVGIIFSSDIKAFAKGILYRPQTRTYYVAAENVNWDYAPLGKDPMTGQKVPSPWGDQTLYKKTRYIEYTDATFTKKKPQPVYQGILGPTIRGVVGDTIKVVFYNKAGQPYSMHPHGVSYTKASEGSTSDMDATPEDADSDTNTTTTLPDADTSAKPSGTQAFMDQAMDGAGAKIMPGHKFTYTWYVRPEAGPSKGQGGSRVWLYHSHVSTHDIYDGLVGPIVITSRQHAGKDAKPDDVDHEFPALFMIFDESKPGMSDDEIEAATKHTINGRFFSNLPGYTMKQGDRVRWYVMGLGNEVDLHTPHWHGNVVNDQGTTTDVVELLPASMKTVNMKPDNPGVWMFHCHVVDHMNAGMMTYYTVNNK